MNGIIHINEIRLYAYHGCLKEESVIGGNYLVDLEIQADLSEAAKSDKLSTTVDYCDVYEIVKEEMKIPSRLIEHVALRIIHTLKKKLPRIEHVRIKLTKIAPPVNGSMGNVSVILEG